MLESSLADLQKLTQGATAEREQRLMRINDAESTAMRAMEAQAALGQRVASMEELAGAATRLEADLRAERALRESREQKASVSTQAALRPLAHTRGTITTITYGSPLAQGSDPTTSTRKTILSAKRAAMASRMSTREIPAVSEQSDMGEEAPSPTSTDRGRVIPSIQEKSNEDHNASVLADLPAEMDDESPLPPLPRATSSVTPPAPAIHYTRPPSTRPGSRAATATPDAAAQRQMAITPDFTSRGGLGMGMMPARGVTPDISSSGYMPPGSRKMPRRPGRK